mmetsp:Transcript_5/g.9  ORF Transcript_5/g.9 Transcript_5/m.9 type:complete len:332 (+) Transcript_5:113-1108(+)
MRRSSNKPSRHVVRMTVLGLSGITVQRGQCRDVQSVETPTPGAPAPPSQMQALVAFTSNNVVKGRTNLSSYLERKKEEPIILRKNYQQTHVALWGSDSSNELGSVVTFEEQLDGGKTFGMTVAMAEEGSHMALPFGVSEFTLTGEECVNGSSLTLNIPVVPLSYSGKMKPLSVVAVDSPKRKGFFSRIRSRKQIFPSSPEEGAFNKTYSILEPSPNSKSIAILRVLLELYEKGSGLEKMFVGKRYRKEPISVIEGQIQTILPSDKEKEEIALKKFDMAEIVIPLQSQMRAVNSSFSMTTQSEADFKHTGVANFFSLGKEKSCVRGCCFCLS